MIKRKWTEKSSKIPIKIVEQDPKNHVIARFFKEKRNIHELERIRRMPWSGFPEKWGAGSLERESFPTGSREPKFGDESNEFQTTGPTGARQVLRTS
ncbi:MAG: hypothetical protein SCM96_07265 [Acidobacteriota bacterium]|nr:hypothetical protein [Acidobacteriota bacterium]